MSAVDVDAVAVVLLGDSGISTARRVQALYSNARVYGLRERVADADVHYDDFGDTLRQLYREDVAIVALCAAGIVIRTLAPLLEEKGAEPPVLALALDGSAVVPLLGGLRGVNAMARVIGAALDVAPAITTSGELRFGTCLLQPPTGYVLADIEHGKKFVSDLLGGKSVRVEGNAHWLEQVQLPRDPAARHVIRVTTQADADDPVALLIHPRTVTVCVRRADADLAAQIRAVCAADNIAFASLACLIATEDLIANRQLDQAAQDLNLPLRFVRQFEKAVIGSSNAFVLQICAKPVDPETVGRPRGELAVIGLGPGAADYMIPAARSALARAQDVLGYATYVDMAGPLRADQIRHASDNREELARARHAFELAAQGRRVAMVSSGDPGVFAMASAVLEALHASDDPQWHAVELRIYPGVSAALATAARAGAPLGHDFCMLSLSDNLKPWAVIEQRLDAAAGADFALAFYNPISRARPWQLGRALEIVASHRRPDTVVVLGRDIGRPGETLRTLTLGELQPAMVDMRTMVIIGSSTTRAFTRTDGAQPSWVYTPRWYE